MAERLAQRAGAAQRISRSPSSAVKSPSKVLKTTDFGPLGLNWPVYRWVIRVLMALCLSRCVVVYVFCHDLPYAKAKTLLVEEIAVGFAILVCMSKTWHRKRLPGFFLWAFLILLIYLQMAAVNAHGAYAYHQEEMEKLTLEVKSAQKGIEQLLDQVQQTQQEQAETLQNHDSRISYLLRFIYALPEKEKDEQLQKYITEAGSIAWSILEKLTPSN